ncbi:hypothetical protein Ahia01_001101100 [Argonauta hians]
MDPLRVARHGTEQLLVQDLLARRVEVDVVHNAVQNLQNVRLIVDGSSLQNLNEECDHTEAGARVHVQQVLHYALGPLRTVLVESSATIE